MKHTISATLTLLACLSGASYSQQKVDPAVFAQSLKQVSAPGDGIMFGLNDNEEIFAWVGQNWVKVEGRLRQISVGSKDDIWGVNSRNKVYQMTAQGWQERPGHMKQVAVAKGGGAVVGIDLAGYPFFWTGTSWVPYPSAPVLSHIAIGKPTRIYGIGTFGEIYRYRSNKGDWRRIQGNLDKISVGLDGAIAGLNYQNESYTKKDADVEPEVNGTGTAAQWTEGDRNIAAIEIMDNKSYMVLDRNGLVVQRELPHEQAQIIKADLVIDGSFLQPDNSPLVYNPNPGSSVRDANGCVVLEGKLKLKLSPEAMAARSNYDQNLINQQSVCRKGVFTSAAPAPDPSGPAYDVPGVKRLLDFRLTQGKTVEDAPFAAIAVASSTTVQTPIVCQPRIFRNQSHHTFVEFHLPAGSQGRQIQIPGGAYFKYIFPAHHRVWWTNLTFACNAQTGWARTQGEYDADGWFVGTTPSSPYIKVGDF